MQDNDTSGKESFRYFESMGKEFPGIMNELMEEEGVFRRMEVFAGYTNHQIAMDNTNELIRCFQFQENEYDGMSDLLLNALSVSWCEALLLGENRDEMPSIVPLMPKNLKKHYLGYERYYDFLSSQDEH